MKTVIIGGRGIGKTRQLMAACLANEGVFVCQNAERMREKASAYGFHGLKIVSYRDVIDDIKEHPLSYSETTIKGYKSDDNDYFYVDELEGFTQYIFLNHLNGYTLSQE